MRRHLIMVYGPDFLGTDQAFAPCRVHPTPGGGGGAAFSESGCLLQLDPPLHPPPPPGPL